MQQEKSLIKTKYIVLIVALITGAIICASQISWINNFVTRGSLTTGDLYNMAKIEKFKDTNQKIYQVQPTSSLQEAKIIIMGDSFSHVNVGYPRLADQLRKQLRVPVYTYDLNETKNSADIMNPLIFLKKEGFVADGKRRMLFLESVDRSLADRYEYINVKQSASITKQKDVLKNSSSLSSVMTSIGNSIDNFTKTLGTFNASRIKATEYFLTENDIAVAISGFINTVRFRLYKDVPTLTPAYSDNPTALFYTEDVSFYHQQLTDAELDRIGKNLSVISEMLDKKYKITLLFLPMPDKYVVYQGYHAKTSRSDDFFVRLLTSLQNNKVSFIDLYHPLISSAVFPYLPGDTHLNKIGDTIFVSKVVSHISEPLHK